MGVILHDPTAKFKRSFGDRSFTAAAPKIWKGLLDYTLDEKTDLLMFAKGENMW